MSDILQYTANLSANALQEINKRVINHLLVNTILVAGFKVRNKIGGPTMIVQGFLDRVPNIYEAIRKPNAENNAVALRSYAKVQLNTENLTEKQIFGSNLDTNNRPTFIFYKSSLNKEPDHVYDNLFVVCKYWSERDEDYIVIIENLHELELVND